MEITPKKVGLIVKGFSSHLFYFLAPDTVKVELSKVGEILFLEELFYSITGIWG